MSSTHGSVKPAPESKLMLRPELVQRSFVSPPTMMARSAEFSSMKARICSMPKRLALISPVSELHDVSYDGYWLGGSLPSVGMEVVEVDLDTIGNLHAHE
jgi:hypothetical protein